jgi:hypothetical protein
MVRGAYLSRKPERRANTKKGANTKSQANTNFSIATLHDDEEHRMIFQSQ